MVDVSLAGVDYSVFLFPCCLSSTAGSQPLVLTGLVGAEVLRSSSWAISTTLIKIAVLGLLVALVSWPFLKLILLGDRQQVRLSDFFQLGAASIVGLALLTVVLLDASAYLRLNRDVDVHLKHLADDLDNHAKAEVRDAYAQLECLEDKTGSLDRSKFDDGKVSSVNPGSGASSANLGQRGGLPWPVTPLVKTTDWRLVQISSGPIHFLKPLPSSTATVCNASSWGLPSLYPTGSPLATATTSAQSCVDGGGDGLISARTNACPRVGLVVDEW